jgi:hypothetical protein
VLLLEALRLLLPLGLSLPLAACPEALPEAEATTLALLLPLLLPERPALGELPAEALPPGTPELLCTALMEGEEEEEALREELWELLGELVKTGEGLRLPLELWHTLLLAV